MSENIIVIFGGVSCENEISVITGTMAANVLKKGGDVVIPVYISAEGEFFTGDGLADIDNFKDGGYKTFPHAVIANGGVYALGRRGRLKKFIRADAALNCCHGGTGEGGAVSGLCALYGIPLASAGIFESSAFMDKYLTKLVLNSLGVRCVPFVYIRDASGYAEAEKLGYPLIVKPSKLGSSIGIACAENAAELESAVRAAFFYDDGVLIEKYIGGRREINCAAYLSGGKVITSECEEAIARHGILSYDDKYAGGGKSVMPADIPGFVSEKIRGITAEVYSRLNMRGIVRFDFILSGAEAYLGEVNTVPGSLSYYLLSGGFKDFYRVLKEVIAQAHDDFALASGKKILKTGILNNFNSNACKRGAK